MKEMKSEMKELKEVMQASLKELEAVIKSDSKD